MSRPATLQEAETELRELAGRLHKSADSIRAGDNRSNDLRDIVCTSYDGNYGRAGWVVAINGSPPRGTFVTTQYEVIYITIDGRPRRLTEQYANVVINYLRLWEAQQQASDNA